MHGDCREDLPSCLLIASSGGIALGSILISNKIMILSYVILILGLGLTLHFVRDRIGRAMLIIFSIIISLSFIDSVISFLGLIIVWLGSILAIIRSQGKIEAALSFLSTILLPAYFYGGESWAGILAGGVIMFSSIVSYLESRRGHSFMLLTVAPLVILFPPLIDVVASVSALLLSVVLTGIVRKSACPFTTDSGMVFGGVTLSILGVILGITGLVKESIWLALWLTGFLYLEAGVLVPLGPFRSRTS